MGPLLDDAARVSAPLTSDGVRRCAAACGLGVCDLRVGGIVRADARPSLEFLLNTHLGAGVARAVGSSARPGAMSSRAIKVAARPGVAGVVRVAACLAVVDADGVVTGVSSAGAPRSGWPLRHLVEDEVRADGVTLPAAELRPTPGVDAPSVLMPPASLRSCSPRHTPRCRGPSHGLFV
jgi:hypothetical protein